MDDLGHLLLDLADLLAQPFYGGLDLAEPFGEPGAARNSWPGRFTEPVVKEMPDLARHPKQCAKRAPQSDQRGCYRASAHDPQSESRGVRGMHRPLQYPFRRFPLCGMSLLYNQYASLASRWPAHEDMLTLKGVRKYKGPGQLQGLRPGLFSVVVDPGLKTGACAAQLLVTHLGGVLSQVGAGALAGPLEANDGRRPPGGRAAEHGVRFGEFPASTGSVGTDGVVGNSPVGGDVSQSPVVGVGIRHGSSSVSA